MAAVIDLSDLFFETLKDVYYAEKKILKALPKMAKAVGKDTELARAFEKHRQETEGQIDRLEQVFEIIGKKARGKTCDVIEGLTKEAEELMDEVECSATLEAGLLAGAQAVEHYEIARYGTLIEWARLLGHKDAVRLLTQTLNEEKKTDQLLTRLAEADINQRAFAAQQEEEESEEEDSMLDTLRRKMA